MAELSPGAYWSTAAQRYLYPGEPDWSVADYQAVSGDKLDKCQCGASSPAYVFATAIYALDGDVKQRAIVCICETCAQAAGGFAKQQFNIEES
jgi:hypothetical protein